MSDLEGQSHRGTPLCGQAELGTGGAWQRALCGKPLEVPSPGGLAIVARGEGGRGAANQTDFTQTGGGGEGSGIEVPTGDEDLGCPVGREAEEGRGKPRKDQVTE